MIDYDSLLTNDAFKSLEPERVRALIEIMNKIEGRSPAEAFAIIMESAKKLPPGRKLSAAEQSAMLDAMVSALPEADRQRFQGILRVMEKLAAKN